MYSWNTDKRVFTNLHASTHSKEHAPVFFQCLCHPHSSRRIVSRWVEVSLPCCLSVLAPPSLLLCLQVLGVLFCHCFLCCLYVQLLQGPVSPATPFRPAPQVSLLLLSGLFLLFPLWIRLVRLVLEIRYGQENLVRQEHRYLHSLYPVFVP